MSAFNEQVQRRRSPTEPLQAPVSGSPLGSTAHAYGQIRQREQIAQTLLIGQVLRDPILLQRLSDRVYTLLVEEFERQHHRSRNYGEPF